jgi:lysophospholipase L1-like esterase
VISELSLRILGENLYRYHSGSPNPDHVGANIWCLGDSWTQGVGAPVGGGYPERLAALLQADGPWDSGHGTYNLGAAGTNSSQQLSILRQALEFGRPNQVIYLGGSNDYWSLVGVDSRLIRKRFGIGALAASRLQNFRTYKLIFNYAIPTAIRRIRDHWAVFPTIFLQPTDIGMLIKSGRQEEAERILSSRWHPSAEERLLLAAIYYDRGLYQQASIQLEKVKDRFQDADSVLPISLLAAETRRLAENRSPSPETVRFYENFHPREWNTPERVYHALGAGCVEAARGDLVKARDDFQRARKIKESSGDGPGHDMLGEALAEFAKRKPSFNGPAISPMAFLEGLQNAIATNRVHDVLCHDFHSLAALGRQRRFTIVVVEYPTQSMSYVNNALRECSARNGLMYLPTLDTLGDILKQGHISADRGHPDAAGYQLLAEEIYKDIHRLGPPAKK